MRVRDTLLFTITAAFVGLFLGMYFENPVGGAILCTLIASTACIVAAINGKQEAPKDEETDETTKS